MSAKQQANMGSDAMGVIFRVFIIQQVTKCLNFYDISDFGQPIIWTAFVSEVYKLMNVIWFTALP
jgi:hypothetical protein